MRGIRSFIDLDVPAGDYRVEFFRNPGGTDLSGFGEGEVFAGAATISHTGSGSESFSASFPGALGDVITATTTYCSDGPPCAALSSTSEFSAAITAVSDLVIVKGAYFADGTSIPTGSTISAGLQFFFVLYVNNRGAAHSDVSLRDVLDSSFAYQTGSILFDNSVPACAADVCSLAEEAAIVTAVLAGSVGTDGVDGDGVSYTGASFTFDAGDENVLNQQLDIAANRVYAIAFSIRPDRAPFS